MSGFQGEIDEKSMQTHNRVLMAWCISLKIECGCEYEFKRIVGWMKMQIVGHNIERLFIVFRRNKLLGSNNHENRGDISQPKSIMEIFSYNLGIISSKLPSKHYIVHDDRRLHNAPPHQRFWSLTLQVAYNFWGSICRRDLAELILTWHVG